MVRASRRGCLGELLPAAPPRVAVPALPAVAPGAAARSPTASSFRRPGLIVAAIVVVVALVGAGLGGDRASDRPTTRRAGTHGSVTCRPRSRACAVCSSSTRCRCGTSRRAGSSRSVRSAPSKPSAPRRRVADRATESLRAMGLVSGKVDLFAASQGRAGQSRARVLRPGRQGGRDPRRDHVLDVPHRVVLAHELTHVLQDQHFDLNRLEDAVRQAPGQSPEALRAVIEGDATRIEDKYVAGLSANDRADFRPGSARASQSADRGHGRRACRVERAAGRAVRVRAAGAAGRRRRRRQRRGRPRLRARRVHPAALRRADRVAHRAGAGADRRAEGGGRARRRSGRPTSSARSTSTSCSRRGSTARDALAAASAWSGGRSRTVRADGRTCVRGVVDRVDASGGTELERATCSGGPATCRRAWRRCGAREPASRCGRAIRVPPSALASPDAAIRRARNLLVAHNELEVALVRQTNGAGMPLRIVQCAALEFVRSPQLSLLLASPSRRSPRRRSAPRSAPPRPRCGGLRALTGRAGSCRGGPRTEGSVSRQTPVTMCSRPRRRRARSGLVH